MPSGEGRVLRAHPIQWPGPAPLSGLLLAPEVGERIDIVTAAVLAEMGFRPKDNAGCDWGTFAFDSGRFAMARRTGETLLVIDSFDAWSSLLIRYRHRL